LIATWVCWFSLAEKDRREGNPVAFLPPRPACGLSAVIFSLKEAGHQADYQQPTHQYPEIKNTPRHNALLHLLSLPIGSPGRYLNLS
jgi:hypothetical protein